MKVKEFIDLLKTNYVEFSPKDEPYSLTYMHKSQIPDHVLESYVTAIEPVGVLRKQLFTSDSSEGDYVAAVKFEYDGEPVKEAPAQEANAEEERRERPNYNQGFPFNFNPLNGADIFSSMPSPEIIEEITNSQAFQDLMSPEHIQEILQSDDFKDFMEQVTNGTIDIPLPFNVTVHTRRMDDDEDEYNEYDEYEAYDDYDDEDEYEEDYDSYEAYDLYDDDDDDEF